MSLKQIFPIIIAIFLFNRMILGGITPITPAEVEKTISEQTMDSNFFLIDVRDIDEVKNGIIASPYCKPYHMSFNSGEFEANFQRIPKTTPVIVYCRSGNRSNQAAAKMIDAGYAKVSSMTNGINSYAGKLADSTEFKPLSKLPEVSYFRTPVTVTRNSPRYRIVSPSGDRRLQFTLQGRVMKQVGRQENAPVYILERIGEKTSPRISGIHRLIQETE
jgi:rhodanese-related sulfurtransferase